MLPNASAVLSLITIYLQKLVYKKIFLFYTPNSNSKVRLWRKLLPMKHPILRSVIISSFVLSTNISLVSPSAAATTCGSTLTTNEKDAARAKLRTNLGASPYPAETGAQAHHLIPLDLFQKADATKICNYGINLLDGVENGVYLPAKYCTNKAPKASPPYLHRGSHPVYTTYIETRIASSTIKDKASALKLLAEIKNTLTTGVKADPAFPNELNNADPVAKNVPCT